MTCPQISTPGGAVRARHRMRQVDGRWICDCGATTPVAERNPGTPLAAMTAALAGGPCSPYLLLGRLAAHGWVLTPTGAP